MILFQALHMKQGARCRRALEQRSSKVFGMERFVCLNNSYLDVNARFLAVYQFLDMFAFFAAIFLLEICTLAQETHQLCFNNGYEYISNSYFRKHQDSRTRFRKYLLLLDVSHLHPSIISSSSLVMSTTFVMLTTLTLSLTNVSV